MPKNLTKSGMSSVPKSLRGLTNTGKITVSIFTMIFFVLEMFVLVSALEWIWNLEKTDCKCSEYDKRDFIKFNLMFHIIMSPIITFYHLYNLIYRENVQENIYVTSIKIVISILSFINIIFSLQYIQKLKDEKCVCSEDQKREIYYIYNWIKVSLILMSVLISIIGLIIFGYVFFQLAKK